MNEIQNKLFELGYKMDFWYEDGKLDAICISKRHTDGVSLEKVYRVDYIASVIFDDFLSKNSVTLTTNPPRN